MLLIAKLLVAQVCSYEGEVCTGRVVTPRVITQQLDGWPGNGVNLLSHRGPLDPGADLAILVPDKAIGNDAPVITVLRGGQVVFRVGQSGEVYGGGEAAFVSLPGSDGRPALKCSPASGPLGGCFLLLESDMDPLNASAFHGRLSLKNKRPGSDGGVVMQLHGTGRSGAAALNATVLAVDDFGNLWLPDGLIKTTVSMSDRQACQLGSTWDGEFHGRGMFGYVGGAEALQVCTPGSAAADAGYETVCTDRNGACSVADRLALIEARLTALEAQ
jgi:hypothetical protein